MPLPLTQLSAQDFEQLCYELLPRLGFINVKWRAPGADGGRDIDAETFITDPTGYSLLQKWYIECKRYTGSVPREEILPKWHAAFAAGADHLFILTTSQLSNDCLDHLDKLQSTQSRPKVRYWTGLDLELKILGYPDLVERFFPSIGVSKDHRRTHRDREIVLAAQKLSLRVSNSIGQRVAGMASMTDRDVLDARTLHAYMLAISAMLNQSHTKPSHSKQEIDIAEVINECDKITAGQGKLAKNIQIQDGTFVIGKKPYLLIAILELLSNARLYGKPGTAVITLTFDGQGATVDIENEMVSSPDFTPTFPALGFRSSVIASSFPSGAGVGCWLADFLMGEMNVSVTWTIKKTKWAVTLGPLSRVVN